MTRAKKKQRISTRRIERQAAQQATERPHCKQPGDDGANAGEPSLSELRRSLLVAEAARDRCPLPEEILRRASEQREAATARYIQVRHVKPAGFTNEGYLYRIEIASSLFLDASEVVAMVVCGNRTLNAARQAVHARGKKLCVAADGELQVW